MSFVNDHFDTLVKVFETTPRDRVHLREVLSATQAATLKALQFSTKFFSENDDDVFGGPQVRDAWQLELSRLITRLQKYRAEIVPIQVELALPDGEDPLANKFWCGLPPEGEEPPEQEEPKPNDEGGGDAPDGPPLPDIAPGVICIDPLALAPESYHGLIERRSLNEPDGLGAGPVPDAAMPAHLLDQLGILQAHSEEMDAGWFKGLLLRLGASLEDIADTLDPTNLKDTAKKVAIVVGVVVVAGGVLVGIGYLMKSRAKKKRRQNDKD